MPILGTAIGNYLVSLQGLYSVELPENLWEEMRDLVVTAGGGEMNRALLVSDDPATDVPTIRWRDILGWRTTDDRIFVWKRGMREPDTSFQSVVRPFISNRFPGANGGECTLEFLVKLSVTELWRRRGNLPVGNSFEAFLETSGWVTGLLRKFFEGAGSTPGVHWSNQFLEHWAGMLIELDQRLAAFNALVEPRHAWEVVRVSGLPLPSAIVSGNPFLKKPERLHEKEWPHIIEPWNKIVHTLIQPDGGLPLLLAALDRQVIGEKKETSWRQLPWGLVAESPAGVPAPIVGARVFRAHPSPTLLSSESPTYPIAPLPSWWGVSSNDLKQALSRIQEQTPLMPDETGHGLLPLPSSTGRSPYILNTHAGSIIYAHTPKKWRARITVGDIRLRFREDWQHLHVSVVEPQDGADGDAWINPDSIELKATPKVVDVERRNVSSDAADRLSIGLELLVTYTADKDAQSGGLSGSWNVRRSLSVKLVIRYRAAGRWDAGRAVEADVELLVPSPFTPTIIVSDDKGVVVASAPDNQDEFTADLNAGWWTPAITPTVLLKEEGRYTVHVYDGTLAPGTPQFLPIAQPAVDGTSLGTPSGGMFPPQLHNLDDGVLVTNGVPASPGDIAVFKVKERSANLSSGLLSAVRGRPAGRKQPSTAARGSVLGQYQEKIVQALCATSGTLPNSLYQYVISSSNVPVAWPAHPGEATPMFLVGGHAGFALPGIGNGPGIELSRSAEWQKLMQITSAICAALELAPGAEDKWLSGMDFSAIPVQTVRAYVEAHRDLARFAKQQRSADAFWASFPFSIFVVESQAGANFGQLLAVLLSPLHPVRLAWAFGVTQIARNSAADRALFGLVEGWNIPCTGTAVNPAGQRRQLVAIPTDPGTEQDFIGWSALAVLSDSGLADLPVFAAGQPLPWGGRTGINAKVVERALKDYLVLHPHLNSFELDIRSVSPSPRSQEIDEAVLRLVGAASSEEIAQLGGGTRVWNSNYRQGASPTRDKLFSISGDGDRSRPFEWKTYHPGGDSPAEADLALIENASVHLAVVPGTADAVVGLIPLRRFSPPVLEGLTLDQNFTPKSGEDLLGVAGLLREIESQASDAGSALRATPQAHALGLGQGAHWEVLGTFNLDPSLLSALIASSTSPQERRLLWEWRPSWMPLKRKDGNLSNRPYYVIAKIPASLLKALQARQGFTQENATELLRVLGHRGIGLAALNSEAGTQESAAAGFFYAMQLFLPPSGDSPAALFDADKGHFTLGLMPLDPVEPILQALADRELDRRADFLAVGISEANSNVRLCFVPVEVKHHGMPSRPEPIPQSLNDEIKRAREQLARTADLVRHIAQRLAAVPNGCDAGGAYLERLGLATLLDLVMSFTSVAPGAAVRSTVLRRILIGSFTIGVGRPILLWFAPGSAQLSGAPCIIDPYADATRDPAGIREVYIDPITVPALWWTGRQLGPNEVAVRSQVEKVIQSSFSNCAAGQDTAVADLREVLQNVLGIPETQTASPVAPDPDAVVLVPERDSAATTADSCVEPVLPEDTLEPFAGATTKEGPQLGSSVTAKTSLSEAPTSPLEMAPPESLLRDVTSGTPGTSSARALEKSESGQQPPPTVANPRVLIGWSAPTSRWTAVGKLAGSDEVVALDLDHPKTIGIFGYMGSGKSYLLGDLIEAAVEPLPGVNILPAPLAVVVFNYRRNAADRFELSSLAVPNQDATDVQRLSTEYGARPAAVTDIHVLCLPGELRPERRQEYGPLDATELFFDPRTLGAEDWELLMGEPGSEAVFARTIRNTLVDLRSAGEITLENLEQQVLSRLSGQSRTAARLRFDFVRRYISQDRGVHFEQLLRTGRILVVDLRQPLFNKDDALRFFLVCANHISRVQGRFNKMVVFDEAHEYLSEAFGERMEARIRLMRHEGTSYIFATQDVKSIPVGIGRFLSTRFVFDLGTRENLQDLERVAPEFYGYQLTGMKPGHCFVQANTSMNGVFNRPREVRVRPRATQHGGASRIFSGDESGSSK
jgi:DNA helicase HerA-like ATPase